MGTKIDFKQLINEGTVININYEDKMGQEHDEEEQECKLEQLKHLNLDCLDVQDEDTYVEGQPFEIIASKMTNLTRNGKIKKRIIREGYGESPGDLALVRINYNAYVEYEAEPFDSTYARKKPFQFRINRGEVILGLDIAVQSMQINEKSQFLITPDWAYGVNGCLSRIPANATVLFEVELLAITESGVAEHYEQLSDEKQQDFDEVYKFCMALKERGKNCFVTQNYTGAIKEYNQAVHKLESAILKDESEQEKQDDLLLTLYGNLLICYTLSGKPKLGCSFYNKIVRMTKGTNKIVQAKFHFNNAKCLRMLGDYCLAKQRLEIAHRMEPKNEHIAEEMIILTEAIEKYKTFEKKLANRYFADDEKTE